MANKSRFGSRALALQKVLPSAAAVFSALLVCFLALGISRIGFPGAVSAYVQMLFGGLGDLPRYFETGLASSLTRPLGETGVKATLLLLTGLSVSVAFAAGLFNIGAQGQMLVGALVAAVVGLHGGSHPWIALPLCLVSAAAGGALYAWPAAVLKRRRGVHEVLSTIMLNWVAVNLIENWLVVGPLRAHASGTQSRAGTEEILLSARLPRFFTDGSRLNLGLVIAFVLAALVWLWLYRTWRGFETRTVGLNVLAAETAGMPVARRLDEAMAISGALAGVAGAVLVLGTEFQYPSILNAPYGFDGIAMAMIGQGHPLGVTVAALFFGAMRAGGTRLQLLGIHKSFPELVQGLALLGVAAPLAWQRLFVRGKPSAPTPGD